MKIVILGGVAAGAKAAAKARRELPEAEINLYTDDTHISYSACGLPYYIEGNFEDYQLLLVRSPEDFEEKNVHIHLRNRAVKIIPESKQVLIQDLNTQRAFLVDYDKLIIAIGARPVIPHIKNVNLPNVFTLRKIEDGIAIKEKALKSKRATIVGAGYIGMEVLEALVRQNLFVTVIEYAPYVMTIFDEDMSKLIEEQLNSINDGRFEILTSEIVTELSGDADGVKSVRTGTGKEFETDFVVLCAGVTPNVEIVKDAGIELGVTGAIKVNERMETSIKDIYACGDCAEKINIISHSPVWIPLGSTANKEGRVAAINACGGVEDFEGVLGSAVLRYHSLSMSMTGLTEKAAQKRGYDTVSVVITKRDKAGYMPEVKNVTLKLVADRRSHKMLGAQAIGCGDADKRVNTISVGLLRGMTVEDLLDVDLTYAPPFSTSIDILISAARILKSKLN